MKSAILIVHHQGIQANLFINGQKIGDFGSNLNGNSEFQCCLGHQHSVPRPLPATDLEATLKLAAPEFNKIAASTAEKYFSALIIFENDTVTRYKNGVETPESTSRSFPYNVTEVIPTLPLPPILEEESGKKAPKKLKNPIPQKTQEHLVNMGYRGPKDSNKPELDYNNNNYTTIGRMKKIIGSGNMTGTLTIEAMAGQSEPPTFFLHYIPHTKVIHPTDGPGCRTSITCIENNQMLDHLTEMEERLQTSGNALAHSFPH